MRRRSGDEAAKKASESLWAEALTAACAEGQKQKEREEKHNEAVGAEEKKKAAEAAAKAKVDKEQAEAQAAMEKAAKAREAEEKERKEMEAAEADRKAAAEQARPPSHGSRSLPGTSAPRRASGAAPRRLPRPHSIA